jgi:glycosyltransferase involved in cell wall biosynthesis
VDDSNSKISIIVPVYDVEPYIRKCIDSLIYQTFKNIEIVLVDDGSPDRCPAICDEYASADKRVRVLHQSNQGLSGARNAGISAAGGEYIMIVDGDDWIDPDTCELALKAMEKENADVVMFSYMREYAHVSVKKNVFPQECMHADCLIFDEKQTKYSLHRRLVGLIDEEFSHPQNADAIVSACMKLYRKTVVAGELFLDTRLIGSNEDTLFNIHVFGKCKKAVWLDKPLYHYRKTNASSLTTVHRERLFEQWQYLFELMRRYIDLNCPEEVYYRALENRICMGMIGLGLNEVAAKNKSIWKKAGRLKYILNTQLVRNAYSIFRLRYLPVKWKIFFGLCKYRLALPLLIMLHFVRILKQTAK